MSDDLFHYENLNYSFEERLKRFSDEKSYNAYGSSIKIYPILRDEIIERTKQFEPKNITEAIYILLNDSKPICDLGNRKKYINFKDGYGFCGKAGTCQCAKEFISNNLI